MNKNYTQATICSGKTCVTVHGDAAKLLNIIAISIACIVLVHIAQKLLS